jgi:hypothetical protein
MHRTTSSVLAFAATVAAAVQATALIAQQQPADELAFLSLPLTGDFPTPTHPSHQETPKPRFRSEPPPVGKESEVTRGSRGSPD